MEIDDLKFYAKYPFTKDAKQYLDSLKINIDDVEDSIIEQGKNRITSSLTDDSSAAKLKDIELAKEPYLMNEIMSFPIAKVLVALSENIILKKKFAKFESQKAYYFLQSDDDSTLYTIARQFFDVKRDEKRFYVPFQEYLNNAPEGKEYSLVNSEIEQGRVILDKEKLAKLVSRYVYNNVMSAKFEKKDIKNKMFLYYTDELKQNKKYIIPEDLGKVEFEAFPPCMRRIYQDLQTQEKVGHIPRFVFSTFLAGIKMPIDEAINLFRSQPNFNESKTRYYLEHSYGLKSNKTRYSVPACAKVDSYGICHRDQTCRWKHPMTYYSRTKRYKK